MTTPQSCKSRFDLPFYGLGGLLDLLSQMKCSAISAANFMRVLRILFFYFHGTTTFALQFLKISAFWLYSLFKSRVDEAAFFVGKGLVE